MDDAEEARLRSLASEDGALVDLHVDDGGAARFIDDDQDLRLRPVRIERLPQAQLRTTLEGSRKLLS